MNIESYFHQRTLLKEQAKKHRQQCLNCRQPEVQCYCRLVQRFDPKITFAILIHPIEARRRIATGRMSHLCLENSWLIEGKDYSNNSFVNRLIADPDHYPVVLYPGPKSVDITDLSISDKELLFPKKKLLVFVIDGTWATARQMMRLSSNLSHLPRICFNPPGPSNFKVRKQPAPGCYSTIEAIHHTIELVAPLYGLDLSNRPHDNLIHVFSSMVQRQLVFTPARKATTEDDSRNRVSDPAEP